MGKGARFVAATDESEISAIVGLEVAEVREALKSLIRWGWVQHRPEGYEVGYKSGGGGEVFYADTAYAELGELLHGVESLEKAVKIAKKWLRKIEEASDARRF